MTPHGHFHWNELMTHDAEKAKSFFADAIGWTYQEMATEGGVYWICMAGDEAVGGIFNMTGPYYNGMQDHWIGYLSVDRVDDRVARAVANGGKLLRPAFNIPNIGRIAMITTPGGAMMGWMTPAQQ